MITVELHKRKATLASGKAATYWTLRWYGSDGRRYSQSVGRTDKITKSAAEAKRREKEAMINSGQVSRDKPRDITLEQFIAYDLEASRLDLKRSSLESIRHAGAHATAALGPHVLLSKITKAHVGSHQALRHRRTAELPRHARQDAPHAQGDVQSWT